MLLEYNPNYHTPGKNIRLLRKQYALSRRALARLIGLTEKQLQRIEDGENEEPVFEMQVYCRLGQVFPLPEGKDICSPDLFP